MLYVGNGDGIGLGWMGWLSEVIGILRAPSVLIIEKKRNWSLFKPSQSRHLEIFNCAAEFLCTTRGL